MCTTEWSLTEKAQIGMELKYLLYHNTTNLPCVYMKLPYLTTYISAFFCPHNLPHILCLWWKDYLQYQHKSPAYSLKLFCPILLARSSIVFFMLAKSPSPINRIHCHHSQAPSFPSLPHSQGTDSTYPTHNLPLNPYPLFYGSILAQLSFYSGLNDGLNINLGSNNIHQTQPLLGVPCSHTVKLGPHYDNTNALSGNNICHLVVPLWRPHTVSDNCLSPMIQPKLQSPHTCSALVCSWPSWCIFCICSLRFLKRRK